MLKNIAAHFAILVVAVSGLSGCIKVDGKHYRPALFSSGFMDPGLYAIDGEEGHLVHVRPALGNRVHPVFFIERKEKKIDLTYMAVAAKEIKPPHAFLYIVHMYSPVTVGPHGIMGAAERQPGTSNYTIWVKAESDEMNALRETKYADLKNLAGQKYIERVEEYAVEYLNASSSKHSWGKLGSDSGSFYRQALAEMRDAVRKGPDNTYSESNLKGMRRYLMAIGEMPVGDQQLVLSVWNLD